MKQGSALPGFRPAMAFTLIYLALVVLIPLSTIFVKSAELGPAQLLASVAAPRVRAAYALSFGASFAAAAVNLVAGVLVAWVVVRYEFPGRRWVETLVDLPFALPTAVAGIALTAVWSEHGIFGRALGALGVKAAYTLLGVVIALAFVGFPFVVRAVEPVLRALEPELEEAAATLGATRAQTFVRVIAPAIMPAATTGFALAFARALGEYGSVVFISGNMPLRTEIAPFLIMTKLEQFDYAGATAIATVMLLASFALLLAIHRLEAARVG